MARTKGMKIATAAALAAGAAALAVPSMGAGAAAGLQDDRLGAAIQNKASAAEIEQILNQIGQVKPKAVRVNTFWGEIAPTRPSNARRHTDPAYDWSRYDQIFTGLRQRGIRPLAVFWDFPEWASGRQAPTLRGLQVPWNPHAPRRARDYANFVYAFAERYDGTKPNPSAPPARLGRVNMMEALNEPNLKSFFRVGGRSNLAKAKQLHRAAYTQAKRANPRVIFMIGAPGPNSSGRNGNISARRWMNGFTGDRTIKGALAWHVYPANGPRARNPLGVFPRWGDSTNRRLRRQGRTGGILEVIRARNTARNPIVRRSPIYITEAGWTTARTPFRASRVSPSTQARYIRQMFALPQVRRQVALIIQFNHYDNVNWPGGLRTASGAAKPSLNAFRAQSRKRLTGFERRSIR